MFLGGPVFVQALWRRGVLIVSILNGLGCTDPVSEVKPVELPDLSQHPIYRHYDFSQATEIIDIGIQPLWVPTCLISETMRRDDILRRRLSALGFEVRFHSFSKGADVNYFLERGDLEAGIGGDMPALGAAARAKVLVAGLVQEGMCSIVAKKRQFLTELRGKRIAYAFGSNAHYALMDSLATAGIKEHQVEMVMLDVTRMPEALATGVVDAFAAWEPTPTVAATRFPGQTRMHASLCTGFLYFSESFADRSAAAMREIVASQLRAVFWLRDDRILMLNASVWALRAGESLSGTPSVLTAAVYVKLALDDLIGLTSTPLIPAAILREGGRLEREFQFLKQLGMLPPSAEWKEVRSRFDPSLGRGVSVDGVALEVYKRRYHMQSGVEAK